jgi:hypothetical protein
MDTIQNGLPGDTAQMDKYNIRLPALLPRLKCYTDASLLPASQLLLQRRAGIGIFFVNP